MITYFDTSALLKSLVLEDGSREADALLDQASERVTSVATIPEARAGLARRRREGFMSSAALRRAVDGLGTLLSRITVIPLSRSLAIAAGEDAERFGLRGYDAVHLATAKTLGERYVLLATWDAELAHAAVRGGLYAAGILRGSPRPH